METFDWHSRRLLLVDRDEQFRFFALSLFRHQRVDTALGARSPLEIPPILAHHTVDLAFVELDGDDRPLCHFLAWLRHDKNSPAPDLPVLLLARTLEHVQLARVCAFGIHGILRKPLAGEQLLKAVRGVALNPRFFKMAGQHVVADHPLAEELPQPTVRQEKREFRARPPGSGAGQRPGTTLSGAIETISGRQLGKSPGVIELAGMPPKKGRPSGGIELDPISESPSRSLNGNGSGSLVEPPSGPNKDHPALAPSVEQKKKRRRLPEMETPEGNKSPDEGNEIAAPSAPATKTDPSIEEILVRHALWVETSGKQGQRAKLDGHDMSALCLAKARLTQAILRGVDLSASDMTGADLHGADLRDADMLGTNLAGADLSVAKLRHAKLGGARLTGANLKGADLAGADLTGADLGDAELKGANLLGASIKGADLAMVAGLTQPQIEMALGDAKTRLPAGLLLRRDDDPPEKI